jgi:NADH-quinone oxidoreductase subunit L
LPLMFVGWEGVGLCSYLLIGFWYTDRNYAAAARKAFVVNRIGDFGVLVAMFLILSTASTLEFEQINRASFFGDLNVLGMPTGITIATAATLFIFLGCAGKSAQIPLYVWLPDAMAGPTPVSALIHAATMVTAGVYLCCRMSPMMIESSTAMSIIAIIGALTALLAASIALVQTQMKKVLAYSTVSQLGFMFAAVGMGAFSAGIFHVFTHAFFKACLFLGAGSVMHAIHAHGDADIRYLGGLRKYMPKTHWTFLVATLAIAGFPLTSGFFSKDEILTGAASWGASSMNAPWVGWFVFTCLVICAAMTAFYMFRLYIRTFLGEFKGGHAHEHGDEHHEHHEPHESEDAITIPLMFLAVGAAIAGFVGLPHFTHLNWWSHFLTEGGGASVASFESRIIDPPAWPGFLAMGLGTLAGLAGIGLAWVIYVQRKGEPAAALRDRFSGVHKLLWNAWYVDQMYGATIIAGNKVLAVVSANIDRFVVDGLLAKVTAAGAKALGYLFTRTQNGKLYVYTGVFVIGLAGLGWWFTYPHPSLRTSGEESGDPEIPTGSVTWVAGSGLGYEYRWDFDSDGRWDCVPNEGGCVEGWTNVAAPSAVDYTSGSAYHALVAILTLPPRAVQPSEVLLSREHQIEIVVDPDSDGWLGLGGANIETLPLADVSRDWNGGEQNPRGDNEPTVAYRSVARFSGEVPSAARPRAPREVAEPQIRGTIDCTVSDDGTRCGPGAICMDEVCAPSACGDGFVDPVRGEQCDDGNRVGGDSCARCRPTVEVQLVILDRPRGGRRVWGPETHHVLVNDEGGFTVLLGSVQSLHASQLPETAYVQMLIGGEPRGRRVELSETPSHALVLRINDAALEDDDGAYDGLLALAPGGTQRLGSDVELNVGVRVRATVETRNALGNLARSSGETTLRVAGSETASIREAGQ